ncbi:Larval cuticle protein LCP-14 [Amphibalanus amphitrite]|uniref:Larval cuticle protein LCP-14 n=1 Tax=Amphibalanus amphitrite TaxID=1232801 RepID=A0A6A4WT81_AMPAM|nr:Larval cuticle protein LCP-14 [Amphibalanus amphitrite]
MKLIVLFAVVAAAVAAPQDQPQVNIISQTFEQDEQGNYKYAYELDNGQKADQEGRVQPGPEPETGSIDVQGSYAFLADDGNTYSVSYRANEGGYQPEADFLPLAPSQIPEYAQLRQEHPELFWAETQQ